MMDRDVVANAKGISQASNLVLLHPVAIFARNRDERREREGVEEERIGLDEPLTGGASINVLPLDDFLPPARP